ncbi:hypothetical protein CSUI_002066 [Cystoisospora suis]|uniref:Uncharacterized protein n=1 Tax=Cystoisospora suis TaxID=483139 RepID=A0A2C6KJ61_9APIC|nr:hypothetical protein CSUI_002066 [Cystoisospora suis]
MASARNWPMPAPAGFRHCAQDVVNSPCFSTSSLDTATSPPSHLPSFSHLPPAAACADTAIVARVLHPQPHAQARANARAAAVLEEQRRREEEQLAALVAAEAARSPPQQVLQRIKESLHAPHPSVDSLCRSAADLGHLLFSAAAVNTRAGGSTLVAPIVARGHASRPQRHAPHAMGGDGPAVDGTISGERPGLSVLASSFSSVDVSGFQESGPSRGGWEEEEPVADSRFCPATAIYGGSIVGQCAVLLTEILTFTSHPGVRAAAFSQLWRNRELLCYLNLPSQSIAAEGFRRNLLAVLNQQNLDNRTRAMGMILISNGGASIIGQDAAILEATLQSLASLWGEALSLVEQEQFAKTASSAPSTSSCPVSSFLPPPVSSDSLTGASSVTNWATDVPGAGIDRRRLDPPAATFCPDSVFLEKTGRLDVTSQPISSCCSDEEQTPDLVAAASAAGMAEVAFDAIAALLPFLSGDSGIRVLQRICSYTWLPVLQAGEGSEERTQGEGNQDAGVERRLGKYSVERIPESPLAQRRLMALQPLQLFRDPSNQDSASSSLTEGRNFANDDDDESVTRRHLSGGSDGLLQLESGVSRGTVPSPHGSLQRGRCGGCGAASVYYLRMKQSLATMATCVEATHKLALNHADSLGPLQVCFLMKKIYSTKEGTASTPWCSLQRARP